jgi:hypothetical protein
MGHEIHVTRGEGFGVAGARPITAEEWQEIVGSQPALVVSKPGSMFARLGARPVVFNAGVIAATSPGHAELEVLRSIATALGARLFGEDGSELGLSPLTEVRRVVHKAFPGLDVSALTEPIAHDLGIVADGDPVVPREDRQRALQACCDLDAAPAKAALAYLLCRAVQSGGRPAPTLTCAAAHLLRHDAARLEGLRRVPTKAWVEELERLAKQVEKKPGQYVIRRCHACGASNRIPLFAPAEQQPKCGGCKAYLAALE